MALKYIKSSLTGSFFVTISGLNVVEGKGTSSSEALSLLSNLLIFSEEGSVNLEESELFPPLRQKENLKISMSFVFFLPFLFLFLFISFPPSLFFVLAPSSDIASGRVVHVFAIIGLFVFLSFSNIELSSIDSGGGVGISSI